MPNLLPYVEAKPPIPVRANLRGNVVDAVVFGWRGDRVDIRWKTESGNHLGWVPADAVERR